MPLEGRVGQYEIVELLGSGAMGEVYKATDSKMFDRTVAVKILSERLSMNEQARSRFKREVEVASRLQHQNIVTIHDRGETDGRPYFVMEYLDGEELSGMIRDRPGKSLTERLGLARQLCEALDFAHSHQVIHRDIKPGNIMIVRRGGEDQAKLVDFGIVHVERSSLTQAVSQPGTFSYMSPEQLRNDPIDHRSDLFSLGLVLYELFTGVHPFEASSDPLVTGKILNEQPAPLRSHDPGIPKALEAVVLKLLDKDFVQRPQSAREVADALRQIVNRLSTTGFDTDPSAFENLDDMTRQMVENLLDWARQKEAKGDLTGALEAYEKALGLAPDSARLQRKVPRLRHAIESGKELQELLAAAEDRLGKGDVDAARRFLKKAWILNPDSEEVRRLESRIDRVESEGEADPERDRFIDERMGRAERALRGSDLEEARKPLLEILKRYPDDPASRRMLDRLMAIRSANVDFKAYREALSTAREAISAGDRRKAVDECRRASGIWPSDKEWQELERAAEAVPELEERVEEEPVEEEEPPVRMIRRHVEAVPDEKEKEDKTSLMPVWISLAVLLTVLAVALSWWFMKGDGEEVVATNMPSSPVEEKTEPLPEPIEEIPREEPPVTKPETESEPEPESEPEQRIVTPDVRPLVEKKVEEAPVRAEPEEVRETPPPAMPKDSFISGMTCHPEDLVRVANYKVVFRDMGDGSEIVSEPSSRKGNYRITVPPGKYMPLAVLDWSGNRVPLNYRGSTLEISEGQELVYDACDF